MLWYFQLFPGQHTAPIRLSNSLGADFERRFHRKYAYVAVTRSWQVRMLSNHLDGAFCVAIRDEQIKLYTRHPFSLVTMNMTQFVKATLTLGNANVLEIEPTFISDVCKKNLRPRPIHDCLNLLHETNQVVVEQQRSASLVQPGTAVGQTCQPSPQKITPNSQRRRRAAARTRQYKGSVSRLFLCRW